MIKLEYQLGDTIANSRHSKKVRIEKKEGKSSQFKNMAQKEIRVVQDWKTLSCAQHLDINRHMPKQIIKKFQNTWDKNKILQASINKRMIPYKRQGKDCLDFSIATLQTRKYLSNEFQMSEEIWFPTRIL